MKASTIAIGIFSTLFLAGCLTPGGQLGIDSPDGGGTTGGGWQVDGWDNDWDSETDYLYEGNLAVKAGALSGDFGGVLDGDAAPAEVMGFADYGFAHVDVLATSSKGAAMAMVDLMIDPSELKPGTSFTADYEDYESIVAVMGCSGPSSMDMWNENFARTATVDIEATPGQPDSVTVSFTATFGENPYEEYGAPALPSGDTSLSGQFTITVPK